MPRENDNMTAYRAIFPSIRKKTLMMHFMLGICTKRTDLPRAWITKMPYIELRGKKTVDPRTIQVFNQWQKTFKC